MTDEQMAAAQGELAAQGLWQETSAAAGLAGLRALGGRETDGPVVCVATSSGYKDIATATASPAPMAADWSAIKARLVRQDAAGPEAEERPLGPAQVRRQPAHRPLAAASRCAEGRPLPGGWGSPRTGRS
ncbi:hypothetical protein ACFV9D_33505 [Streptomyces sp. NPDC059875]|uniref:hypothetical protein n=1 Tax=unclassified Streptomyces TaxID=2593676 RepID=UPI00365CA9CA